MLNIVLLEPEIPANTGNIGRTCVAAGARLHLIEPMGFQINEKQVRRAGLDYWDKLDYRIYDSYRDFVEKTPVLRFIWRRQKRAMFIRRCLLRMTVISCLEKRAQESRKNFW